MILKSAQRVDSRQPEDNYVYQRSLKAYIEAEEYIGGDVLELGCGEGYHIDSLSKNCNRYIAIDKYKSKRFNCFSSNVEFIRMKVPPFNYIPFNSYDVVLCFQVIEHINDDLSFLKEIYRVLKPGGILLMTTPNTGMTLTRNPWHCREYTVQQFHTLINKVFSDYKVFGVHGNKEVMEYYGANRQAVERLARIDFLKLHRNLPAPLYRPVFDVLNRINKLSLNKKQRQTNSLCHSDFYVCAESMNTALDFFCVAKKTCNKPCFNGEAQVR